jgi:hypothetical protein
MQKQSGVHITFAEWLEETKANYEKLTIHSLGTLIARTKAAA